MVLANHSHNVSTPINTSVELGQPRLTTYQIIIGKFNHQKRKKKKEKDIDQPVRPTVSQLQTRSMQGCCVAHQRGVRVQLPCYFGPGTGHPGIWGIKELQPGTWDQLSPGAGCWAPLDPRRYYLNTGTTYLIAICLDPLAKTTSLLSSTHTYCSGDAKSQ